MPACAGPSTPQDVLGNSPNDKDMAPPTAGEWQRVRERLLQQERRLAQLTARHARGEIPAEQIQALQAEVTVLRNLAEALFQEVFGGRER